MSPSATTTPTTRPQPTHPPFATDDVDSHSYHNDRHSALGALGMDLLSADLDDDSDDDEPPAPIYSPDPVPRPLLRSFPIAAPKPGYASPVAALNLALPSPVATRQPVPPSPLAQPQPRQRPPVAVAIPYPQPAFMPSPIAVPSTPHPLLPPVTPITPAFARPPKPPASRDVAFAQVPVIRSNSEETLLPKRGEKGDDFWRRFSMVAHEDRGNKHQRSTWLLKTESGYSRMSRWVWCVGLLIVLLIGGGIALGLWLTHNNSANTIPIAIGGSANDGTTPFSSSSSTQAAPSSSSSPHVSPTRVVNKRTASPAQPTALHVPRRLTARNASALPAHRHAHLWSHSHH